MNEWKDIQPLKWQKTTNVKEHKQALEKINELVDRINTGSTAPIDELPTKDSRHLVRSGGVFTAVGCVENIAKDVKTKSDLDEIESYFPDLEAQEEKAQRELNLRRLRHYQDQIKSYYFTDEGLESIKKDLEGKINSESKNKDDTLHFKNVHDGLIYEHEVGKKAFAFACEVIDKARKFGLPHPDEYESMQRIYPYVDVKSERAIIQKLLKELEIEAEKSKIKFKERHFV